MGNGIKVQVVAIGTFCLFLETSCYLDLFQTLYVPSISCNLVSLSKLDLDGYYFTFRNKKFNLFKNTIFIGSRNLCDGLYKLNHNSHFAENLLTLHHNVGTKRSLINEKFIHLVAQTIGSYIQRKIREISKR
jgi:hypothetical protein